MTGSIIKRGDKTYLLRLSLGKDSVTGKRLYHTETVHGTKKEAETRLRDLLGEYERGGLNKRSSRTLNEFLGEWFKAAKANISARTLQDYEGIWTRYIKDDIGRFRLDKLTPLKVQGLYTSLSERGLSPLTVRRLHTVLNQALKQAVRWRMLGHNPAADIQLPSLKRKRVAKSFEVDQAHQFLKVCAGHRLGAAFSLAIETGMRPQEYTALQWADIDLKKHQVHVHKTLFWKKGGGWVLNDATKTDKSHRMIALSPEVVEDLKRHRRAQLEERVFLGPDWKGGAHDFVFTNSFGGALSPGVLNKAYKAILKAANLPNMRVYDLRHSHATMMLQGGVSPKVASERLGHYVASYLLVRVAGVDTASPEASPVQKEFHLVKSQEPESSPRGLSFEGDLRAAKHQQANAPIHWPCL